MPIVSNVKHWRNRVEETLVVARSLKHEEARRVTLELALVYGRLAEIAERHQARQTASAASAATRPADQPQLRTASPASLFVSELKERARAAAMNDSIGTAKRPATPIGAP